VADAQRQAVAFLEIRIRFLERAIAHLGEVQQPFQAIVQGDESAEVDDVGNRALDLLALMVGLHDGYPRIGQQALAAEGDAVGVAVQAEDVDIDLLADAQHVTRVVNPVPGQLADVDQAISPAQVHKRAEVAQAGDGAPDNLPFG